MTPVALTPDQKRVRQIDAELKQLDKDIEKLLRKMDVLQQERLFIVLKAEQQERLGMMLERRRPFRIPSDDFLKGVVGAPRQEKVRVKKPGKQKELPQDLKEW